MIGQAPLRVAAAVCAVAVLSSCGSMQRPTDPSGTSSFARGMASLHRIQAGGVVEGQAIVTLKLGAMFSDFLARHDLVEVERVDLEGTLYYLVASTSQPAVELVEALQNDKDVEEADFNRYLQAPEYEGTPMSFDDEDGKLTEAHYASQPQLTRIHLQEALATSQGDGAHVAVLDTGIDRFHPAWGATPIVMGKDWSVHPHGPSADETADDKDFDDDGDPHEAYGHGTHVTGIVHLTAPHATLIAVRVLNDDGWGTAFGLAAGINDALELDAQVINMSLGLTHDVGVVRRAVQVATNQGVALIASAGNQSSRDGQYPAAYPDVYAVAAVDPGDKLATFSNYGTHIDVSAPGVGIVSLYARAPGRGLYASGGGTSMAAPFLAGAAALLIAADPGADGRHATEAVKMNAPSVDGLNPLFAGIMGRGRVDLYAALPHNEVSPPPGDEPTPVAPAPGGPVKPVLQPRTR